jgi:NAD(P)-dependent dehydrogenase (short-subunit alcohol dehydrogenase family)
MSRPAVVAVIGATRGLGHSLVTYYSKRPNTTVYGTSRQSSPPNESSTVKWITNVDVGTPSAGSTITGVLPSSSTIDTLIVSAGYFGKESFEEPNWDAEERMYRTSAIGPVFLVSKLVHAGKLGKGAKVVMVSSESGSITLRHEKEGGGNYGHHASKAALNMVVKLLSLDLKEKEIAVCSVHPGFMRTEMTKSVGFDQFWDDGGGKIILLWT